MGCLLSCILLLLVVGVLAGVLAGCDGLRASRRSGAGASPCSGAWRKTCAAFWTGHGGFLCRPPCGPFSPSFLSSCAALTLPRPAGLACGPRRSTLVGQQTTQVDAALHQQTTHIYADFRTQLPRRLPHLAVASHASSRSAQLRPRRSAAATFTSSN